LYKYFSSLFYTLIKHTVYILRSIFYIHNMNSKKRHRTLVKNNIWLGCIRCLVPILFFRPLAFYSIELIGKKKTMDKYDRLTIIPAVEPYIETNLKHPTPLPYNITCRYIHMILYIQGDSHYMNQIFYVLWKYITICNRHVF